MYHENRLDIAVKDEILNYALSPVDVEAIACIIDFCVLYIIVQDYSTTLLS